MRRALAPLLLAGTLAGCGLGAGRTPGGVSLDVTRDFGTRARQQLNSPRVVGQETVMQLLMRNARVGTRYGGGFVQSIDGLAGGHEGGRPLDWFFYVNGIEAGQGAAATTLHPGDRVWWDRHDWGAAMRVPAVVGAFPEPFLHGLAGKRYPVRLECANFTGEACRTVRARLRAVGVAAALGSPAATGKGTLRVVVGVWAAVRGDTGLRQIESGPASSGVYARFSRDGRTLSVLDGRGRSVRTLAAGGGLVAATRYLDGAPTWAITGTDDAGVSAAARALDPATLRDHFAVAVSAAGAVPAPEVGA